jgi:hypothetical protein
MGRPRAGYGQRLMTYALPRLNTKRNRHGIHAN